MTVEIIKSSKRRMKCQGFAIEHTLVLSIVWKKSILQNVDEVSECIGRRRLYVRDENSKEIVYVSPYFTVYENIRNEKLGHAQFYNNFLFDKIEEFNSVSILSKRKRGNSDDGGKQKKKRKIYFC